MIFGADVDDPKSSRKFCAPKIRKTRCRLKFILRTGRPPTEVQNPQTPKSARESAQRGPARNGVLGEMLGKVLVLLVPRRDTRGKHFSEHFPEHPVSGRHLSEHSPEHFWGLGVLRFCRGPPRSQNLSSTELESENAIGAFLQTPAPVLDKISGPKGAEFSSSTGLGLDNLIERAQFSPAPALDKNRSPRVLEKAGPVDFKKHPARKVGTRSQQCGPKVPGRFALPGARNPGIRSISQFGKIFQQFSRDFPGVFLGNPQTDPGNSHSLLEFSEKSLSRL